MFLKCCYSGSPVGRRVLIVLLSNHMPSLVLFYLPKIGNQGGVVIMVMDNVAVSKIAMYSILSFESCTVVYTMNIMGSCIFNVFLGKWSC